MSEIKVGEVVVVKTTGEQVFVLAVLDDTENENTPSVGMLHGGVADVRIPVLTRDGIEHQTFRFSVEELETTDDRMQREMAQQMEMAKSFSTLPVANDAGDPGEPVN